MGASNHMSKSCIWKDYYSKKIEVFSLSSLNAINTADRLQRRMPFMFLV